MAKPKRLKIWNGALMIRGKQPHIYAAAHSRADLLRMLEAWLGWRVPESEIRDYWSEGCWGRAMDGIAIERGLWVQHDGWGTPERVR
jgi:hypothetical protein